MKSIEIGYQNDVIKKYLKLKKGDTTTPYQFVVEGIWAYEKILNTHVEIIDIIYCETLVKSPLQQKILNQMMKKAVNRYKLSEKNMRRLYHKEDLGCMVSICRLTPTGNQINKVVILDGLENPGNIGTIFRTCDGAGIDAVFIVNQKTKVNQYKVIKASMGGCLNVPWFHFETVEACQNWLHDRAFTTLLAHPSEEATFDKKCSSKNVALVLGNERYGLSKQWFYKDAEVVSIPMFGCCDSLNVGVAASILIYKKMIGSA